MPMVAIRFSDRGIVTVMHDLRSWLVAVCIQSAAFRDGLDDHGRINKVKFKNDDEVAAFFAAFGT